MIVKSKKAYVLAMGVYRRTSLPLVTSENWTLVPEEVSAAWWLKCRTAVSEFKLESCYYIHFGTIILVKGMNTLIAWAMGYMVLQLIF